MTTKTWEITVVEKEDEPCMTTKKLETLKQLNEAGLNDHEIAEALGLTRHTVYYWRHRVLGLPPNRVSVTHGLNQYLVTRRKDDSFVAMGTAAECAEKMGVKLCTFFSLLCPSKTRGKWEITKLLDDDEEEGDEK